MGFLQGEGLHGRMAISSKGETCSDSLADKDTEVVTPISWIALDDMDLGPHLTDEHFVLVNDRTGLQLGDVERAVQKLIASPISELVGAGSELVGAPMRTTKCGVAGHGKKT